MSMPSVFSPGRLTALAMMLVVLSAGPSAFSQTSNWNDSTGGDYNDPANWNNGVPDITIAAIFALDKTYGINLSADVQASRVAIQADRVTFSGGHRLVVANEILVQGGGSFTLVGPGTDVSASSLLLGSTGSGAMVIKGGATLSTDSSIIGKSIASPSAALVSGAGSRWNIVSGLAVGQGSDGSLQILDGGVVENKGNSLVGALPGTNGNVNVSGNGSEFNSDNLYLGAQSNGTAGGTGSLNVDAGATVHVGNDRPVPASGSNLIVSDSADSTMLIANGSSANVNGDTHIGYSAETSGTLNVAGTGSDLTSTGNLFVGENGTGALNVTDGGTVSGFSVQVAEAGGSTGELNISGAGSQLVSQSFLGIGGHGTGSLLVSDGGTMQSSTGFVGSGSQGTGIATITGSGSRWDMTGEFQIGYFNDGSVNVLDGAVITNNDATIGAATLSPTSVAEMNVDGAGSQWINSGNLTVGDQNNGTAGLQVTGGGLVSSNQLLVGQTTGSSGDLTVSGANSELNVQNALHVGGNGTVSLHVDNGGTINSGSGSFVGGSAGSGDMTITGAGSNWTMLGDFSAGYYGNGTVNVLDGGLLENDNGFLASLALGGSPFEMNVAGSGAHWKNNGDLSIGGSGSGSSSIGIGNGGLISVAGTTTIAASAPVTLTGGRFEFGQTDADSYHRISGTSGELAGSVGFNGYNHISSLDLTNGSLDVSEVVAGNSGVVYGSGVAATGIANFQSGEIRALSGEWQRIGGIGNTNAGEINNYGGVIEYENDLTNEVGGFIAGRGQFITGGGLTNNGVMAFSGGFADVGGDVVVSSSGQVIVSGGSTATFFDDVAHNGIEIRTAENSELVFFGEYSGAGSFTGTGNVYFEGDLRPGNSPDVIDFGGNVFLGSNAFTFIEIAGIASGEYDAFNIAGDFGIDGVLDVELINSYALGAGFEEYMIADVGGTVTGQFDGLSEGALVGSYGGRKLFISYARGDGNDVALFTAVPEPSSLGILLLTSLGMFRRRRNKV